MVASLTSLNERRAPAAVDARREYVAAGGFFSSRVGSALGQLFNDAEYAIGVGGFEQMLTDPEVLKDVTVLVDAILGDGTQILPVFTDEKTDKERADTAAEYAALCRLNLYDSPRKPFKETLAEVVRAAYVTGHKMAEQTWRDGVDGGGQPLLVLDCIKVKPRHAAQFVVDRFMNVLGVEAWGADGSRVIPREKFFIISFDCRDEDPRGTAPAMRAAYNWWIAKRAALPIRLKRLEKKAVPSLAGFTAEDEGSLTEAVDTDGNTVQQTATEVMAEKLANLDQNSAAAFPHGADVKVLDASGDGAEFDSFFAMCDRQITRAILLQDLATNEGQHGTRAQASVQMDVLALRIWHLKNLIAESIRTDICKTFLALNRGPEAAAFAPVVTLGDSDRRDWATDAKAAALIAPYIPDSIWAAICAQLGLPMPAEGEAWPARGKQASVDVGDNDPEKEAMTVAEGLALFNNAVSAVRAADGLRAAAGN